MAQSQQHRDQNQNQNPKSELPIIYTHMRIIYRVANGGAMAMLWERR